MMPYLSSNGVNGSQGILIESSPTHFKRPPRFCISSSIRLVALISALHCHKTRVFLNQV